MRPPLLERLRTGFDDWACQGFEVGTTRLGFCRILYAAFNLVFLFDFRLLWLAGLPDGFFAPPPGIASLFPGFPSASSLAILHSALIILNVLLLVGWRTRLVSVLYSLLLMALFSLVFSLGNIYHVILWLLVPLVLAPAGWGDRLSLDGRRTPARPAPPAWPLTLMALLVGFAFFTSGFAKLAGGWLDPEASATWQHFMRVYHGVGRDQLLAPLVARIAAPLFWETADWLIVFWEVGFLLAVAGRRLFRVFCALGVFFHLAVLLILNISFSIHMVVFVLFLDWERLESALGLDRLYRGLTKLMNRIAWWHLALFTALYLLAFFGNPDYSRVDGATPFDFLAIGAGVAVCVHALASPRRGAGGEAT